MVSVIVSLQRDTHARSILTYTVRDGQPATLGTKGLQRSKNKLPFEIIN